MKHTPGPWEAKTVTSDHVLAPTVWSKNGQIAVVGPSTDHYEVMNVNARLVAAAPEMLEELKSIVRTITTAENLLDTASDKRSKNTITIQEYRSLMQSFRRDAQKAIDKAEGK